MPEQSRFLTSEEAYKRTPNPHNAIGGLTNFPAVHGAFSMVGGHGGHGGSSYGGYGGGYRRPSTPIDSSGVAGGIPTSQRRRADLALKNNPALDPMAAWKGAAKPAYQQASENWRRNAMKPAYGSLLPPTNPAVPNTMIPPSPVGSALPAPVSGALNPFQFPNAMMPLPMNQFAEGTKDSGPKAQTALVGEGGPELLNVPAHSQIIPNGALPSFMQMPSAFSEATGAQDEPYDGEIRADSEGNQWKYDAKQKRGIPLNPYLFNENAPSPDSFESTPSERYNDLAMRLGALRKAGIMEGRAAVDNVKAQQALELSQSRLPESERGRIAIPADKGGGQMVVGKYGMGIVGGNRPKSFTVERMDNTQQKYPDVASASTESMADSAQRRAEGYVSPRAVASPVAVAPSALEEVTGVTESPVVEEVAAPIVEAPVSPLSRRGRRVVGEDDNENRPIRDTPYRRPVKSPTAVRVIPSPIERAVRPVGQTAKTIFNLPATAIKGQIKGAKAALRGVESAYDWLTSPTYEPVR